MKFETKMSGVRVTDYEIESIFNSQFVWLSEIVEKIHRQETMNFILDTFRFYKGEAEKANDWCAIFDWDTIEKISILENYPQYEKELVDYFGENWLKYYIRFNH